MVTTRRGPVEDRTPQSTPRSSARKSKRTLETEDTPTAAKRRKGAPRKKIEEIASAEGDDSFAEEVSASTNESLQSVDTQEDEPNAVDISPSTPVRGRPKKQDTPKSKEVSSIKQAKLPIRRGRSAGPVVVIPKQPTPTVDLDTTSADTIQNEEGPSSQEGEFHTSLTEQFRTKEGFGGAEDVEEEDASTPKATEPAITLRSGKKLDDTPVSASKKRSSDVIQDTDVQASDDASLDDEDILVWEEAEVADSDAASEDEELEEEKVAEGADSSASEEDDQPTPTASNTLAAKAASPPQPKKTHVRFGSEEPTETPQPAIPESVSTQTPADEDEDEDDDASDSDDAPEQVATAAARTKTLAASEDAERAFAAQEARKAAKRKERAHRIASEQAAKKKREERKAKKLAKRAARNGMDAEPVKAPYDFNLGMGGSLPALLPTELLEAAGDQRPPTPPPEVTGLSAEQRRQEKLRRHIKFLERGEKSIKDVKRGDRKVRVLGQENKFLAPPANRQSKSVREQWLKGRQNAKKAGGPKNRLQFTKMERRPVKRGFVDADDD